MRLIFELVRGYLLYFTIVNYFLNRQLPKYSIPNSLIYPKYYIHNGCTFFLSNDNFHGHFSECCFIHRIYCSRCFANWWASYSSSWFSQDFTPWFTNWWTSSYSSSCLSLKWACASTKIKPCFTDRWTSYSSYQCATSTNSKPYFVNRLTNSSSFLSYQCTTSIRHQLHTMFSQLVC